MGTTHTSYHLSHSTGFVARPASDVSTTGLGTGYLAAVTPALEEALALAHEAGQERAVRILHAVIAILDDPALR